MRSYNNSTQNKCVFVLPASAATQSVNPLPPLLASASLPPMASAQSRQVPLDLPPAAHSVSVQDTNNMLQTERDRKNPGQKIPIWPRGV